MDQSQPDTSGRSRWRRYGAAGALLAGGMLAGGVVAGTLSANAANSPSPSSSVPSAGGYASSAQRGPMDESRSQRGDEHLLTGTTASKVRAAALAKYPGARVLRVETDSDGAYEAHLVTSAGQRVTVEVGKDFAVTGLEANPRGGGPGRGGPPGTGQAPTSGYGTGYGPPPGYGPGGSSTDGGTAA